MSGLLDIWTSFILQDSINLQDLLVTEYSSHPKDPDFQREQHTCALKSNINEVYPNCISKRMFQKRWSLFRLFGSWLNWGLYEYPPIFFFLFFSFLQWRIKALWKWANNETTAYSNYIHRRPLITLQNSVNA